MNRAQRRAEAKVVRRTMNDPRKMRALQVGLKRAEERRLAESVPEDEALSLALLAHEAVSALSAGQADEIHLNNLAVIANMTMVLCDQGIGSDYIDDAIAAQHSIASIQARLARTGKVGATGPELLMVRAMVDLHDQQLHSGMQRKDFQAAAAEMFRRSQAGNLIEVPA